MSWARIPAGSPPFHAQDGRFRGCQEAPEGRLIATLTATHAVARLVLRGRAAVNHARLSVVHRFEGGSSARVRRRRRSACPREWLAKDRHQELLRLGAATNIDDHDPIALPIPRRASPRDVCVSDIRWVIAVNLGGNARPLFLIWEIVDRYTLRVDAKDSGVPHQRRSSLPAFYRERPNGRARTLQLGDEPLNAFRDSRARRGDGRGGRRRLLRTRCQPDRCRIGWSQRRAWLGGC